MSNSNCDNGELYNLIYNIAWLRKREQLSKKKMAKLLGIGLKSMNAIENGEIPKRLGSKVVIAVCQNFGTRPSELFEKRFGGVGTFP